MNHVFMCVNIKHTNSINPESKPTSIFVFQSGNIIITGAKYIENILEAYEFIRKILNKNVSKIIRKEINIDILNLVKIKPKNNKISETEERNT